MNHIEFNHTIYDVTYTYKRILFPTQLYKIARTTLCWEDGKALALRRPQKEKKDKHKINQTNNTAAKL